jgi:hypothetical protein
LNYSGTLNVLKQAEPLVLLVDRLESTHGITWSCHLEPKTAQFLNTLECVCLVFNGDMWLLERNLSQNNTAEPDGLLVELPLNFSGQCCHVCQVHREERTAELNHHEIAGLLIHIKVADFQNALFSLNNLVGQARPCRHQRELLFVLLTVVLKAVFVELRADLGARGPQKLQVFLRDLSWLLGQVEV